MGGDGCGSGYNGWLYSDGCDGWLLWWWLFIVMDVMDDGCDGGCNEWLNSDGCDGW